MHVNPHAEGVPQDAGRVLSALEGAGLQRGCILSPGYQKPSGCQSPDCPSQQDWTRKSNDWTLEQARKNRDLIPFCGIPISAAWGKEEVERCAAGGARGLKLHPVAEGLSLKAPQVFTSLQRLAQAAEAAGMPILIHLPFEDADTETFIRLADEQPKTIFIVAHQLGPKGGLLIKAPSNVYVDISGLVLAPREAAPKFVSMWRGIGMRRILLGSDWPLLHPAEHLATLRTFPLSREEFDLITERNARRLWP